MNGYEAVRSPVQYRHRQKSGTLTRDTYRRWGEEMSLFDDCRELDQRPGEECGFNAICNQDFKCVCDHLFLRTGDFGGVTETDCFGQATALYSIYSTVIIIILVSTIFHFSQIRSFSHIKTLLPFIFGVSVSLLFYILKIVNVTGRPIGQDILITLLFAIVIPISFIGHYLTQNRYFYLQRKLVPILGKAYENKVENRRKLMLLFTIGSLLSSLSFAISLAFDDNDTKLPVLKIGFGFLALSSFGFMCTLAAIGRSFIRDLKSNTFKDKHIAKIMVRAKEGTRVGIICFVVVFCVSVSVLPAKQTLFFATYTIHIQFAAMFITSIFILRANMRKVKKVEYKKYLDKRGNRKSLQAMVSSYKEKEKNTSTSVTDAII